jgi:hypothetical protein
MDTGNRTAINKIMLDACPARTQNPAQGKRRGTGIYNTTQHCRYIRAFSEISIQAKNKPGPGLNKSMRTRRAAMGAPRWANHDGLHPSLAYYAPSGLWRGDFSPEGAAICQHRAQALCRGRHDSGLAPKGRNQIFGDVQVTAGTLFLN